MPHVRPFSEPTAVPGQAGPRNDGELPLDRRIAGFGGDRKQRSSRLRARGLGDVYKRQELSPRLPGEASLAGLSNVTTLLSPPK